MSDAITYFTAIAGVLNLGCSLPLAYSAGQITTEGNDNESTRLLVLALLMQLCGGALLVVAADLGAR